MKTCRCGCGESVKGLRRSRQYVDDSHRQRHGRARRAAESVAPSEPEPERTAPEPNIVYPGMPGGEPSWADEDDRRWRGWGGYE
jgi:hypothetical protein